MMFVTVKKLSNLIGYTEDAIRSKITKGVWHKNHHWVKAPDGRILIHLPRVNAWIEGRRG